MTDEAKTAPLPAVTDRATWQAQLDELLVREKAHTHEGDAIAAARRRLPMVEVDAAITLTGARGPASLLEVFEGRRQLIVYYHMWHTGQLAAAQCEGCTFLLAEGVPYRWRPVPASRAAHRAVGAPGGRPVRRPRHRHRLGPSEVVRRGCATERGCGQTCR